jgi:hypothetical protein
MAGGIMSNNSASGSTKAASRRSRGTQPSGLAHSHKPGLHARIGKARLCAGRGRRLIRAASDQEHVVTLGFAGQHQSAIPR